MQGHSLKNLGQVSRLSELYQQYNLEYIRKGKLAEKVLSGKQLNRLEKEEIYKLLTGKEPPPAAKRGRTSTVDRDFSLAVDYLYQKAEGKKRTDILRQQLAKKHGLSGRENTFYVALNRGIEDWHELATYWIDHYNIGGFSNLDEKEKQINYERMQRALQLISDYRKTGTKLQKKLKE